MSVTSLEIMTGAYWDRNPNVLFMMRKPSFLQRLDEDLRPVYTEAEQSASESLSVLKQKVKSHFPERVEEYDCSVEGREGKRAVLGNLDHFGRTILEYFKARIAEQYPHTPSEEELSLTEMKRASQEEFMLQRSEVLLGRDREIQEIDWYLGSDTPPGLLALVGFPGAGKSALMAYSARRWLQDASCKVFFHFIGVTPDSTSTYSVLSRMYRECMPRDQQDSMPVDSDDMARFAPTMFQEAAAEARRAGFKKLVVFIDALNQLDDTGKAHRLTWLPRQLPQGMRVVVSTLEGQCLESLRNHPHPAQEVTVNPLNTDVRKHIVKEWLQPYNKRLDNEQLEILVSKEDAGRPLFLCIACEELRVFGEFRKLTDKVQTLSDSLTGMVEIVLHRTVEEFGKELVQAALCLIETSHFGLEEEELLHLLAIKPVLPTSPKDCSPSDFKEKLPMAVWGFMYVGLRSFLRPSGSSGEGRVDFYHRSISKVVRKMYFADPQESAKWHGRLIQYFSGCSNITRKAEELPYHYIEVDDAEGLRRCLLERSMFEHLYTENNKQLLMQYWQKAGGYPLAATSYQNALQDYLALLGGGADSSEGDKLSTKVAWFLVDIGEYDAARRLLDGIIARISARHGPESVELADPLHATMQLLMSKALKYVYGSHPGYKECVKQGRNLVTLTVKVHRQKYPANSNALGNVLSLCGYFDYNLLEECRSIFTTNSNKVGLAVVLYTLAEKKQYHDDINVPIQLFKESLALCRLYFGLYHQNTARCEQLYGQLFWNNWISNRRNDWLEECLEHYLVELDILQEILGKDHPTTVRSREDVIIVLQSLGRHGEADRHLADQPDTRDGIA
ncbi:TPR repeat-containing protein DDB_G0287407-like [Babylonia areolata]|uniref:TPR repeat-containing protein DDB_G0287407-like n=1 Tax=Babylonia areolata TaxID=304850 RepID=UPI003FD42E73